MSASFPFEKFQFNSNFLFEELPRADISMLEEKMTFRMYRKKQNVFTEGSYQSGVFYLKKGMVKKYKTDKEGREHIFYICIQGELFGYPALLSEDPCPDSASALEDSEIGFIAKNDFLQILDRSHRIEKFLLKNLSHEFGVMINQISGLAQKTVRERLALNLIILEERFHAYNCQGKESQINLSREDLASMTGTVIETLTRLLRSFKNEGLINVNGRSITIINRKELIKIADFY
jgi:CRP-like cAMP-binding protein